MTKRNYDKVAFTEVQPFINTLRNIGINEGELANRLGYTGAGVSNWRRDGHVRRVVWWALRGMVYELTERKKVKETEFNGKLDYNQVELLFSALRAYRKAAPTRDSDIKPLLALMSTEMVKLL